MLSRLARLIGGGREEDDAAVGGTPTGETVARELVVDRDGPGGLAVAGDVALAQRDVQRLYVAASDRFDLAAVPDGAAIAEVRVDETDAVVDVAWSDPLVETE